ncbi:hypothetical protein [Capnocytophaga leadbetteri]
MESSNKIGAGCALLVSFISVSISLFNIFHKETYTAELTDSSRMFAYQPPKETLQTITSLQDSIQDPEVQKAIPYLLVTEAPAFGGKCTQVAAKHQWTCFKESMDDFMREHLNISGDICVKGAIHLTLCIGTDGVVRTLKMQLSTELITSEVQRVIAQLPTLQPARKDGKIVSVIYRYKYEIGKLEN